MEEEENKMYPYLSLRVQMLPHRSSIAPFTLLTCLHSAH